MPPSFCFFNAGFSLVHHFPGRSRHVDGDTYQTMWSAQHDAQSLMTHCALAIESFEDTTTTASADAVCTIAKARKKKTTQRCALGLVSGTDGVGGGLT